MSNPNDNAQTDRSLPAEFKLYYDLQPSQNSPAPLLIALHGVVGICGGIPGDWETNDIYKPTPASVFHLAGTRDEFYPPSRVSDYAEKLQTRAANVAFKTYDAGHEIIPEMRADVGEWLFEHSAND